MLPLASSASTMETGDGFLEGVNRLLDPVLDNDEVGRVDVDKLALVISERELQHRTDGRRFGREVS